MYPRAISKRVWPIGFTILTVVFYIFCLHMQPYIYSIIIPHKNIPDLLLRCLGSIPQREDIQVIIVDDNSDPNIVDFDHFPGLDRPNAKVFFDKTGKGAGRARNIGLDHVLGQWILFADADDFFTTEVSNLLDYYKDSQSDIIFFKHKNVVSSDISQEGDRCYFFNDIIDGDLPAEEKERILRCRHNTPWSKIYKFSFIQNFGIRYEEIPFSNDIFFNVSAGCLAPRIEISKHTLYVLTNRDGSLTSGNCQGFEELRIRAMAHIRMQAIAEANGYESDYSLSSGFLDIAYNRDKRLFRQLLKYCRERKLNSYKILKRLCHLHRSYSKLHLIIQFLLSYFVS